LVLVVLSVLLMGVFRTIELMEERRGLAALHDLQDNALQERGKLRQQFETFGEGVAALAAAGDSNAKAVVDAMHQEGVILPEPKR